MIIKKISRITNPDSFDSTLEIILQVPSMLVNDENLNDDEMCDRIGRGFVAELKRLVSHNR